MGNKQNNKIKQRLKEQIAQKDPRIYDVGDIIDY